MTTNLIKLCVGVSEPAQLIAYQTKRIAERQGRRTTYAWTRRQPVQTEELIDGGSLYWVMNGLIRCRQSVLGFEQAPDAEGIPQCLILLNPDVVMTNPVPRRPFQGWRYLKPADAPPDLDAGGDLGQMPLEMLRELKNLGLL